MSKLYQGHEYKRPQADVLAAWLIEPRPAHPGCRKAAAGL